MVGDKGTLVPGGQKQRIAIERAVCDSCSSQLQAWIRRAKRKKYYLFKHSLTIAMSFEIHADDTEETLCKVVQQALDNVRVGRTTLVMVHRQLTIRHADCLVVFRIRSSCGTTKSQTTFSHERDLLCFK